MHALTMVVETPHPVMDALRLGLVFIPGIIIVAMSLVVVAKYTRVYFMDVKLTRAQGVRHTWRGLLPAHVAVITTSYSGLVVMLLISVGMRFREPLYSTPRLIIYSVLLWLGVAALRIMTSVSKRRAVAIETLKPDKALREDQGPPPLGYRGPCKRSS